MPIIETRIGVIVLKSVRLASRKSSAKAVPTESAGEEDRHACGHERAEHDQQHDQRDQDADELAGALLGRRLVGVTRELGLDAGLAERAPHRVLEIDDLGAVSWNPSFENCTSA